MKVRRSPCLSASPAVLHSLADERLAELARDGSEAAFEVIVARHRRGLVRVCTRILGEADAEEAVQETLLKAHAAIIRGDQVVRTVDPWLRAIARNTGLNMLRARVSRPTMPDHDAACLQLTDASAEHRQRLQEVLSAVAALPPRQREAMLLREFEGRSYEEIGARLGATDGAVRQLLNRARGALRSRVGAFAGFEPMLRWLIGNGGGEGAVRLSALSGGCAITVKLCTSALPAALVLGSVSPMPKPADKGRVSAPWEGNRPSAAARQFTALAPTAATNAGVALSSIWLRAGPGSPAASSSRISARALVPPVAGKPTGASPHSNSGMPPSPVAPLAPGATASPRPHPAHGIASGSPVPADHGGPGTSTGTGTAPARRSAPISVTEATRRPVGQSQPAPVGSSTSSVTSPGPGVGNHPAARTPHP